MSITVNDKNLGHATAYAYAKSAGYTGTEAEFAELLGNIADDLSEIENLRATATTLPAGSAATASYADGVLTLGIPKGDKGDKGDTGAQGPKGDTGEVSYAEFNPVVADVTQLKSDLTEIATVTRPEDIDLKSYAYKQGYLASGGVFTPTSGSNAQKTTDPISLSAGDYKVTFDGEYISQGTTTPVKYVRAIGIYDANDTCTRFLQTANLENFTVLETDAYVRINVQYTNANIYTVTPLSGGISAKINDDVEIPTDSTLTAVAKAANAKATGDAIANISGYKAYRRPLIAFNFDGEYNRNANFKALFDQHNKKCGYALPYSTNFPYTTKETYLTWQNEGFEILAHSAVAVGTQSTATDDEIRQIVKDAYTTLTGYGFNIHGFVAYQGNAKPVAVDQVQRMYDYGATVTNHAGNLSGDLARANSYFSQDKPYKLWRYSMQASTLDQMKSAVDECYDTYGLVIFYGHANSSQLNNMTLENIDALLTYIEAKGIQIMTPYEAIKDFYTVRSQDFITN